MSNLTEQWEKGELPLGMYYVKTPFGVEIHSDYSLYRYKLTRDVDSIEVLAPVPSYEEWKQLHKFLEEFNALDVAEDNKKLKELLKQWMYFYPIILYEHEDTLKTKDIIELFDKTANAIGEKK